MFDLSNPIFTNPDKARSHLEALRWVNGRFCPHCGATEGTVAVKGSTERPGLYYCNNCTGQFSVTVGTVMERSHIPLHKWVAAFHLMSASKKGISAHQIHRMLGITYKSAWFMAHRVREAMRPAKGSPMGGEGSVVEADETYIGGKAKNKHVNERGKLGTGTQNKEVAVSLVERGGKVRSFHVEEVSSKNVKQILRTQLNERTYVVTDESSIYKGIGQRFAGHSTVNHSAGEYVRHSVVHTNTVENYFSILKRGITGVYHHVSQQHLKRYLAEFDFRYNERKGLGVDDAMRAARAIKGIEGKRLTYRRVNEAV